MSSFQHTSVQKQILCHLDQPILLYFQNALPDHKKNKKKFKIKQVQRLQQQGTFIQIENSCVYQPNYHSHSLQQEFLKVHTNVSVLLDQQDLADPGSVTDACWVSDLGPVKNTQPNLFHKTVVGIKWKREQQGKPCWVPTRKKGGVCINNKELQNSQKTMGLYIANHDQHRITQSYKRVQSHGMKTLNLSLSENFEVPCLLNPATSSEQFSVMYTLH